MQHATPIDLDYLTDGCAEIPGVPGVRARVFRAVPGGVQTRTRSCDHIHCPNTQPHRQFYSLCTYPLLCLQFTFQPADQEFSIREPTQAHVTKISIIL